MLRTLVIAALACSACAGQAPGQEPEVLSASYPEGALWQDERLYFAEMGADRVTIYENRQARPFFTQQGCGPTAIAPYGDGFLILCHLAARVVAVDAAGREIRRWDRDHAGARLMDPNDVAADGRGGVYFSDPGRFSRATRPHGAVMHLSVAGVLTRAAGPLWYPNGVFVDIANRKLYVDEHMSGRVLRYDIVADGRLEGPSVFADVNELRLPRRYEDAYAETGPDGIEIGPDGDVYIALYGEGRVLRFSPRGGLLGSIETASRYTTSIGFGPDGRAAITSVYEHDAPPFRGEVRVYSAAALTGARE
jgi:sugar lactone lactonase YvrE